MGLLVRRDMVIYAFFFLGGLFIGGAVGFVAAALCAAAKQADAHLDAGSRPR